MTDRNPLHCILPPVLLEHIARNGTEQQRNRALDTLSTDHAMRTTRLHGLIGQRASLRSVGRQKTADETVQRTIYTANSTENLPGDVVRSEGSEPSGDAATDEAYDGLGATFAFYSDNFGRNSIDDEGLPLHASVHYGQQYNNAFWDGTQMVFGDGDGQLFNRFTISLDVIGHELTHGVTEDEAGLAYMDQSGALNESMSDVFGSLVKQGKLGQTSDQADWLIGAGLFTSQIQGVALRSMKAPGTAYDDPTIGKDPQPAHMRDYVETVKDNGGVHINSGIPNHAFYLAANSMGGYAAEKAGRIWYDALRDDRIKPTTRFRAFALATVRAAKRTFGDVEVKAVSAAWHEVGIDA